LGKQRILEIYLNVVEWGPGIYGADAACHDYDGTAARNTDRQEAARRDFTGSPEATARAHESTERAHPGANATNGLVTERRHGYKNKFSPSEHGPKTVLLWE